MKRILNRQAGDYSPIDNKVINHLFQIQVTYNQGIPQKHYIIQ